MFITFEGVEGSGKTTQIRLTARYLASRGLPFITTREPGSTPIGRKIRAILLDPDHTGLDHRAELLLYMADRSHHIHTVILPALREGKVVLCDRYADATMAYQGYGRGLDRELIQMLHQRVLDGLDPDLTFLLDLPPESGLARAWSQIDSGARGREEARFEAETLSFHRKVRSGYLNIARRAPQRFRIIEASSDTAAVQRAIRHTLDAALPTG